MRSYLQRMAAGVLSRERAIHPIVGSLWAPRHDVDSMKTPGETLVMGEDPHRTQASDSNRTQPKSAGSVRASAEPHAVSRASTFVPGIAETATSPLQPLLPQTAPQNAPFISDSRAAGPSESEAGPRPEASQPQPQRIFVPLLHSRAPEAQQQSVSSLRSAAAAQAVTRADAARRQPQANTPAHEPDAIEIHIGRIEVLAAPQQKEQRAAAPAPRKSLDLGEYLRRGRAR